MHLICLRCTQCWLSHRRRHGLCLIHGRLPLDNGNCLYCVWPYHRTLRKTVVPVGCCDICLSFHLPRSFNALFSLWLDGRDSWPNNLHYCGTRFGDLCLLVRQTDCVALNWCTRRHWWILPRNFVLLPYLCMHRLGLSLVYDHFGCDLRSSWRLRFLQMQQVARSLCNKRNRLLHLRSRLGLLFRRLGRSW